MKNNRKRNFLLAFGSILTLAILVVLFSVLHTHKYKLLIKENEASEVINISIDEKPEFNCLNDSLKWMSDVDFEIMSRYLADMNPVKYGPKADSIAMLLKTITLPISIRVLEKKRGMNETIDILYMKLKFNYEINCFNDKLVKNEIQRWKEGFYLFFNLIPESYVIHLNNRAVKNSDIMFLANSFDKKTVNYIYSRDNLSQLLDFSTLSASRLIIFSLSDRYQFTLNQFNICDLIKIEKLVDDYRFAKLISSKRLDEVVNYLEKNSYRSTLMYLHLAKKKDRFEGILKNHVWSMDLKELHYCFQHDWLTKANIKDVIEQSSCAKLSSFEIPYNLDEFLKEIGINNFECIVLNSINNKEHVIMAEKFFNKHEYLYKDLKYVQISLKEKWNSY